MTNRSKIVLLAAGGLAIVAVAIVYVRELDAWAEIDELERIPVLDEEPAV